jgi:probable LLM family oxidoreductase
MELGVFTFVDNTPIGGKGERLSPTQRIQNLLEEIRLADQVGLDVFGIGEHHRPEYVASAPTTLLAAAAAQTKNIKLTSSVVVLGSEDPVRVYQQFSTIDLISQGRAEIMIGRGSFIESFPLFGQDLNDYDDIFTEKMDLLMKIQENEIVHWKGKHRPSIDGRGVYPRPYQDKLPMWIAVGGTPQSAYRAGYLGIPMAIAIIGGEPARFKAFADLHKRGADDAGIPQAKISINSHGVVAESFDDAFNTAFPAYKVTMDTIGRERGWAPMTKEQFQASTTLKGANFIGDPQQTIDKILYQYEIFKHDRFMIQMSVGTLPHDKMLKSIELFGEKVAPVIRKETKK